MKVTWNKNEEEVLINYFEKFGSKYCLRYLDSPRSLKAIAKKARSLGIIKNKPWTEKEIKLLKEKWKQSKKQDLKILFPNRTYNALLSKATEIGLKMEKGFRKRIGDLSFLDDINQQSVYWWGLFLADGHLSKNNELSISVHNNDREYLKVLTDKLNVDLREYRQMCLFSIGNKKFSEKWKTLLHMSDDCTKTYCPPKLDIFKYHMIPLFLGLIDGDGHIRFSNGHYSCTIELFNTWFETFKLFQNELNHLRITSDIKYTKKGKYCRMIIVGKDNLRLLKELTKPFPVLKRKWDKIL